MDIDRHDLFGWLQGYLLRTFHIELNEPTTEIEKLGLDSLEKVGICARLSDHLGDMVDPTLLMDCETCGEFIECVAAGINKNAAQRPLAVAPARNAESHSYARYVNPYLAEKMAKIYLDKQFVRGEGSYLFDSEGHRYLDFMAQYGALPFGHNPPAIWRALRAAENSAAPNFVQPSLLDAAGELAAQLLRHAPANMSYVTFANSGAESIEAAIKLARSATGRAAILSTDGGFHGKTIGALSASGKYAYQQPFHLNFSEFNRVPFGDLDALQRELTAAPGHYAAFIVEPIQGEGGVIVPPANYLHKAQRLCAKAGVLLVIDEVQTGLGRTGVVFMSSAQNVLPDILVTAKALGGGLMPIGAVISTAEVFNEKFALKHSSTFAGNTLAARAGLATLALLESDDGALLKQVKANGDFLLDELRYLQQLYPSVIQEVRGVGYLIGVQLTASHADDNYNFISIAARVGELAQFFTGYLLNAERVRVVPTLNSGNVVRVEPPLTATRVECEYFLAAFARAIAVFASANTGKIYQAIIRQRPLVTESAARRQLQQTKPSGPPISRFAFLLHPLNADSYRVFDQSLDCLTNSELERFATTMDGLVDSFVASEVVIEAGQRIAQGDLILVNYTADHLKSMPKHEAIALLKGAVALAKQRGNQLVGLGAYTSVLSQAGLALVDEGIPLTSGNAYTVVASLDVAELVMQGLKRRWSDTCAAVVGAGGSIGRSLAMILAEHVGSLVLIGNPLRGAAALRKQLLTIAAQICMHLCKELKTGRRFPAHTIGDHLQALPQLPAAFDDLDSFIWVAEILEKNFGCFVLTAQPDALRAADMVFTATSFPGSSFDYNHLKANAIVCDISRPRSIDAGIRSARPDVLVVDGGVVDVPSAPDLTPYGLPLGQSYACLAETMILALAGEYEAAVPGPELDIAYIKKIAALGKQFGFGISSVQSFGRTIALDDWQTHRIDAFSQSASVA